MTERRIEDSLHNYVVLTQIMTMFRFVTRRKMQQNLGLLPAVGG